MAREQATPRPRARWALAALAAVLLLAALPRLPGFYWSVRTSNDVRRGVALMGELGCEHCHGALGQGGVANPSATDEPGPVAGWIDNAWYEYLINEDQLRRILQHGRLDESDAPEPGEMHMPAYVDFLDDGELDDLVAAFKVISGMVRPPRGSSARSGHELAKRWDCFSCHGPGGSGGLVNPGSLTGVVPGWYGPAFEDLVRDRGEFDDWIREGTTARLQQGLLAGYFLERQRVFMPAYPDFSDEDLDALWAYTRWLAKTRGGHQAKIELP
jgi:cytochrome c551/c552